MQGGPCVNGAFLFHLLCSFYKNVEDVITCVLFQQVTNYKNEVLGIAKDYVAATKHAVSTSFLNKCFEKFNFVDVLL